MDNKEIYTSKYTLKNVSLDPKTAYDVHLIDLRFAQIETYGKGGHVVDLCCGAGAYLIPSLDKFKSATAIDFSKTMLEGLLKQWPENPPATLQVIDSDARELPLPSETADFLYSYSALYYIPDVEKCLAEISRVLKPRAVAAFELGNFWSLNTLVSYVCHKDSDWARGFHISLPRMRQLLKRYNLEVVRHDSFQLLPMYGTPRRLFFLRPLLTEKWKHLMGLKIGQKNLDQWLCSFWPLRYIAFRHFFVVRKSA